MSDTLTEGQARNAARILDRRFRKPPKKHRSRAPNLHPTLDFLFDEMDHLEMSDSELQVKAGISANVLSTWRSGKGPTVANLEPVLNVIGYTLAAVPLPETKK